MTPEATVYFEEVVDYIQQYSMKRADVDWKEIRCDAIACVREAQTSADTYPAIRWVLSRLGDHHSFFLSPEAMKQRREGMATSIGLLVVYPEGVIVDVHPNSPADYAGLQVRDIVETINGELGTHLDRRAFQTALRTSPVSLAFKRAGQESLSCVTLQAATYKREMKPQGWPLKTIIGYLELPAVSGSEMISKTYATEVQQLIREMDKVTIRHWVVDLRRNRGGNMWPMLAGVGPLLGEGECGSFLYPEREKTSWSYRNGHVEAWAMALVDEPYSLKHPGGAIAVLTSQFTCSSGEFITLAFRGCPRARSFGEPTAGLATANRSKTLKDGAMLFLTVARGADRTGCPYDSPIIPDQAVKSDWTLLQTEHDPVLLAAVDWLKMQPGETRT